MENTRTKFISAESVTQGHPDKVADSISDALVTAYFKQDKASHVAIETLVTTNLVVIAGEIKSTARVNKAKIIRDTIQAIGYTVDDVGFDYGSVDILDFTHEQSADIDMGVSREIAEDQGAGDQGFMIGFACNETDTLMPLPIALAHALTNKLTAVRKSGHSKYLLADGKSQVSIKYEDGKVVGVDSVLISCQHLDVPMEDVKEEIVELVIAPVLDDFGYKVWDVREILVNPTGRFVIGGPNGDTGLTGRKIVVDQYGPACPVGGGAFSGKDPSKVDRSAAYAARWVAKNVVAAGLADACEVQIAYAIGVAEPTSIYIDTKGTAKGVSEQEIEEAVKAVFDLRPYAICRDLALLEVDYSKVQEIGTFGNDAFPWEQLDKVQDLHAYFKPEEETASAEPATN